MDPAGARILDSEQPLLHGLNGGFVLTKGSGSELTSEAVHLVDTRIARITAQGPVIAQIGVQPGFTVFVFAGERSPHSVNGRSAGMHDLLLLGAHSETVHRTPGPSSWFGGAVFGDSLHARASELGSEGLLPRARGFERVSCSPEAVRTLKRRIEALLAMGRDGLVDADLSAAAEDLVLDQVAEMIAVASAADEGSFERDPADQGTLRLVRDYLEHSRNHQVTVAELCDACFVSERTLRDLFLRTYGVRPKRYLKMRALTRLRTALQHADPDEVTTEQVAAAVGLQLTGRLAADYRLLFEELPSQTLRARA
jgi:AraC family ethanolamine operon transcriptional activator